MDAIAVPPASMTPSRVSTEASLRHKACFGPEVAAKIAGGAPPAVIVDVLRRQCDGLRAMCIDLRQQTRVLVTGNGSLGAAGCRRALALLEGWWVSHVGLIDTLVGKAMLTNLQARVVLDRFERDTAGSRSAVSSFVGRYPLPSNILGDIADFPRDADTLCRTIEDRLSAEERELFPTFLRFAPQPGAEVAA